GDIALSERNYDDRRSAVFYEQVLTRLRNVPGVTAAGAAGWVPVAGAGVLWGTYPEGRSFAPGQMPDAVPQEITPGYIRAMGLTLLAGRDFSSSDRAESTPVVIVSKQLAKFFWPNEDPLGKRMKLGTPEKPWMTVVGVVSDIRARGFDDT